MKPALDVRKPVNIHPAGMGTQKGEILEKLVMGFQDRALHVHRCDIFRN